MSSFNRRYIRTDRRILGYVKPVGCVLVAISAVLFPILWLVNTIIWKIGEYYGFDKCVQLHERASIIAKHLSNCNSSDSPSVDSCVLATLSELNLPVRRKYTYEKNSYFVLGSNVFRECGLVVVAKRKPSLKHERRIYYSISMVLWFFIMKSRLFLISYAVVIWSY